MTDPGTADPAGSAAAGPAAAGPAAAGPPPAVRAGLGALLRPRLRRVDLLVALLLLALGFAAAVQVRTTRVEGVLASARQEDLVQILDDLSGRSDRLRGEIAQLTTARERLTTDGDAAALDEARRRTQVLGVLAGTIAATGPGIRLTMTDTSGGVRADVLLDALEELRAAGAEAVQLGGAGGPDVRVVAATSFTDETGAVRVDGIRLSAPFTFTVLGDPGTLASAMGIPGGVVATVARVGGQARVEQVDALEVGALRAVSAPRYARPAPGG